MKGSVIAGEDLRIEARLDDPAFYLGDPLPTYARLRREAPVFWCESGKFWALSKHADIAWLEMQPNPPFTTMQGLNITEAVKPSRVLQLRAEQLGSARQPGFAVMSDPPDHARYRRLVGGAFGPARMPNLGMRITSIVSDLLDALPLGDVVDFVEAVSVPLSIRVIGELLGVPPGDWDELRRWTDSYLLDLTGGFTEGTPEARRAMSDQKDMYQYLGQSLDDRRRAPRDDLMSMVASLAVEDAPLPAATQIGICISVLIAGNETTRNALSGAIAAFAEHPAQWGVLRDRPDLLDNAVEEALRWVTPVIHFARRATEPVTIRGETIAAGDFVVMLYGSANRDEEVWSDADVFDVARPSSGRHLSFGWGLHRCIGAGLARAEIRGTLEGMLRRFRGWDLAETPTRNASLQVNDYHEVPITLEPV